MINQYGYILEGKISSEDKNLLTNTDDRKFYIIEDGFVILPQYYALEMKYDVKKQNLRKGFRDYEDVYNEQYIPRPMQSELLGQARSYFKKMSGGGVTLEITTGTGKTFMALYLMRQFKTRTLIFLPTTLLLRQWESEINNIFNNSLLIGKYNSKNKLDLSKNYDVILTTYSSATNISMFHKDIYEYIINNMDMVIYDEVQCMGSENRVEYMLFRYNLPFKLALSATPYRPDGISDYFKYFFSDNKVVFKQDIHNDKKIVQFYYYHNNNAYDVQKTSSGNLKMAAMLNDIAYDLVRNKCIHKLILELREKGYYPLVISNRTQQIDEIYSFFDTTMHSNVFRLYKGKYMTDKDKETTTIVLGEKTQAGVGMDNTKINAIVLACGSRQPWSIEQWVGRCMRKKHFRPILIYDIVDTYFPNVFKKWRDVRAESYRKLGFIMYHRKLISTENV